jgi:hypothetical protein
VLNCLVSCAFTAVTSGDVLTLSVRDLRFERGEISGCFKTTVFRLDTKVLADDYGQFLMYEKEWISASPHICYKVARNGYLYCEICGECFSFVLL